MSRSVRATMLGCAGCLALAPSCSTKREATTLSEQAAQAGTEPASTEGATQAGRGKAIGDPCDSRHGWQRFVPPEEVAAALPAAGGTPRPPVVQLAPGTLDEAHLPPGVGF